MDEELLNYLQQVASLLAQHSAVEVTLRWGENRITLRRSPQRALAPMAPPAKAPPETLPPAPPEEKPAPEILRAHLVGIFHRGQEEESPRVEVGDFVPAGAVVAFIESMRVMNEVISPVSGRVEAIFVEDGQPVEYGQELMRIVPEEVKP